MVGAGVCVGVLVEVVAVVGGSYVFIITVVFGEGYEALFLMVVGGMAIITVECGCIIVVGTDTTVLDTPPMTGSQSLILLARTPPLPPPQVVLPVAPFSAPPLWSYVR